MRRSEIREGIEQILKTLESSGVDKFLDRERPQGRPDRGENEQSATKFLEALKEYTILESRFTTATKKIEGILQLDRLCNTDLWQHLVSGQDPGVRGLLSGVFLQAKGIFPKFVALLDQKDTEDYLDNFKASADTNQYCKLTVIILEEEVQFSRPERLIQVLTGFTDLYEACARLEHVTTNELTVLSCDSGSDKSFDFLGLAKVMEQVKEIFMGLWDRVVFYKEKRLSSQIEVIAQGLPILAKITELQATNHISQEEAEIVRRGILKGCSNILHAGAIIPEINEHATFNPRVLMAPEQKLLMPPPIPQPEEKKSGDSDIVPNANPEEETADERIQQIEKMLSDLKNEKKPKSKRAPKIEDEAT